jgi:RNA polymerase sigma-70 factor (ECF subfamily)
VAKLRPEHRELVRLRYGQGASIETAARTTGRTVEAIYKALSRIRKMLIECVDRKLAAGGGI